MHPPKVVVFDLGKVLVDFDYSQAARRIAARSSTAPERVQQFIDHSPLLARYESGQLTTPEFFQEVCRATGFAGSLSEFSEYFADIFTEMPETIALHARLRGDGIPVYLFSNSNDLAISHIRRRFPFFAQFDDYIISYERGALKPHAPIYEAVERAALCTGADIAYLDDRPENVAAGAARGWRTVLHQSASQTTQALRSWGLRC